MATTKVKTTESKMTKKNEAFWALPKTEKRVAIAKDVIKWIKAKKFIPVRGTYLSLSGPGVIKEDKPLDKLLRVEPCGACALGACFIGLVDLGNNIKLSQVAWAELKEDEEGNDTGPILGYNAELNDDKFRIHLRKIFSPSQISMIECAFEMSNLTDGKDETSSWDHREKASRFGEKYHNDDERLIAIMENIIQNKGIFKP